ncbi:MULTISPECIES: Zn-ribbon domain-containing OB-fold protein [unclassified Nocardioides]|uniref:Zn-ribbon domain-containing OB-fold protein n=1 Tax=unclassified Nocardioides TaxID=2615069 RepID=UPI0007038ED4|nr:MULTISPECIES: OB-fold nucleic acid binding domain-containing protein [unclassified Nocardioides]KRC50059.1 DNA-binding protein [Nocardioides sp. Root79]KRC75527.1 DNA-binding protein [Nocardioides sp. Root240]
MSRTLQAPVTVAFDYTRSTGPVVGRFLSGLRDGVVVGARTSTGQVVVPPLEFDPVTHEATTEFVEVSSVGTVTSWTWVPEPVKGQPFDRPFAFALVTLDGADVPFLHALDVSSPAEVTTGMRVRVRWAAERVGHINDIACFEPLAPGEAAATAPAASSSEPVTGVVTEVSLDYDYAASPEESLFYRGLNEGRIMGQRCPTCQKVYVPPRSACPSDGTPTAEEVELSQTGTITTFCIVNVPFLGQKITPPYVSAYVLLDGADIAVLHLILGVPADEVRMGMRVRAVWKPEEEWAYSLENIDHFAPTGEPDADYDTYKHHL